MLDTYEISNEGGQPLYFYEFHWGNTIWYYTASDRDIPLGATTYAAAAINHGQIVSGGQSSGQFTITCDPSLPVVGLFRATPPSENVKVIVLRKQADDPELKVLFTGKIDNVKLSASNESATILCSIGKMKRGGLRLTWSRTCPFILYDGQCRVLMSSKASAAAIATVTGTGFTLTAAPNPTVGYFDGGILEWDADGLGTLERRAIESGSSATAFVLFGRSDGLSPGMAVTLYPGCDHLAQTCKDKFNNLVNFGGIEQLPDESPYGQNVF